jgi:hypothetical protein
MAEQKSEGDNFQFLLTDFNTRLRDISERNRLIRERVLLLGQNLISSKQESEESLKKIKKDNSEIKRKIENLEKISNNLLTEFNKFIKRDEMILIERMLKDFQPLEFMRKKDVEDLIDQKFSTKKEIKTKVSTK